MELIKVLQSLIIPRETSFISTVLMITIILCGMYIAYEIGNILIEKNEEERKKTIKEYSKYISKALKDITYKQYEMCPVLLNGEKISLEKFSLLCMSGAILLGTFFSFTMKIPFIIMMIISILLGVFFIKKTISLRYNKRKKTFEGIMAKVTTVIATYAAQSKEIDEIIDEIIRMEIYPASEEFALMKRESKKHHSHQDGYNLLKERYEDSLFIPLIADLLEVYEVRKKEITHLVEIADKQSQGFIVNQKKAENTISPYVGAIYIIVSVVYIFFIVSCFMSPMTIQYYKKNIGLFILLNCFNVAAIYLLKVIQQWAIQDITMKKIEED